MAAVAPFKWSESNTPYYTNGYKTTCLHFLLQNPTLSFKQYQRKSGDFNCRESAFLDVKNDLEVWPELQALIIKPKVSHIDLTVPVSQVQTKPAQGPTIIVNEEERSAANKIALGEKKKDYKRLDAALKSIMEEAIEANPAITFDELQKINPWPDFKIGNFYNMKSYLRLAERIPHESGGRGQKMSPEQARVRKHLSDLTHPQLEEVTLKTYQRLYGHHVEPHHFNNGKRWAMERLKPSAKKSQVEAHHQEMDEARVQKNREHKRAYRILPEIMLTEMPETCFPYVKMVLNNFIQKHIRQAVKSPGSIQCRLLADPPRLEILQEVFI